MGRRVKSRSMNQITLRIKKVYYDAIRDGTKTVEYRKQSNFYDRLFFNPISSIRLHYQGPCKLVCDVERVEVIKRPKHVDPEIVPTANVYAIHLKNPREYK